MSQNNDQVIRGVFNCDKCNMEVPALWQGQGFICNKCMGDTKQISGGDRMWNEQVKAAAEKFAHEYGRREIPTKPGVKFSRPDPDLYWGLSQGFIEGAAYAKGEMDSLRAQFAIAKDALEHLTYYTHKCGNSGCKIGLDLITPKEK